MQGKSVLVTGAGPIGLCGVIAAKALGATTIGMIDYARRFPAENDRRLQNRLRAATSCGADCNIIAGLSDKPGSVKKIHEAMGGPPDIVIENTGNDKLIPITAASLAYGGVMVITGISMPVGDVIASITDVVFREVDIRGSLFYPADFSSVVDMIGSGRCNVKQLITHRFPLEKAPEAFQLVRHGGIEETLTKVLVQCDDTF